MKRSTALVACTLLAACAALTALGVVQRHRADPRVPWRQFMRDADAGFVAKLCEGPISTVWAPVVDRTPLSLTHRLCSRYAWIASYKTHNGGTIDRKVIVPVKQTDLDALETALVHDNTVVEYRCGIMW